MGQAARWDAEQDPGFLIADVARLLRAAFERQISETGLTRTQWQALVYLIRQEGLTQTELAQRLDIGKATVGGVIDRLARAGLVERRDDPIDRRANRVLIYSEKPSIPSGHRQFPWFHATVFQDRVVLHQPP